MVIKTTCYWMNLTGIMLSEGSRVQRTICIWFHVILDPSLERLTLGTENRSLVPRPEEGREGWLQMGPEGFGGLMKPSYVTVMFTWLYAFVQICRMIH